MKAMRLHVAPGHPWSRSVAVAAIAVILCAIALGLALTGHQVPVTGNGGAALGTFSAHAAAPEAGPVRANPTATDGGSPLFSGPDQVTAQFLGAA